MNYKPLVESFDSFDADDAALRREYWSMTKDQRLEILEQLRMQTYPDGQTAPRLQRVLETVKYIPR